MLYFLICFALAALPAVAAPPEITPVAVFTHFERLPPEAVPAAMEQEVDRIMSPLGFPLSWKSLDTVRGNEVATTLAVVTFRGNCDSTRLLQPASLTGALGLTHVSDGVVIPFTDIDCDGIRAFLRKELLGFQPWDRDARLGRAVGRVLAHELFHIFVGTVHHGSGGVAKPVFTERELMAEYFQFEANEFRLLRASLRQARQTNQRQHPAASPFSGEFIFKENGCARCHGKSGQGSKLGPALRLAGKATDMKALAARLAHDAVRMCSRAKSHGVSADPLDADEIADVASFLGGS
jgi:mono/diheme cytochrome c family protein